VIPTRVNAILARLLILSGIVVTLTMTGCGSGGRSAATVSRTVPPVAPVPPRPDVALPTTAPRAGIALTRVSRLLRKQVLEWLATPAMQLPPSVELQGLYQQRLYMKLNSHPNFAQASLRHLPHNVRRQAANILIARRGLGALTRASKLVRVRVAQPPSAKALLKDYQVAEHHFRVPWNVLAAVNFVESQFGRVRSPSGAGAQGPMQFIPATWAAYGLGGNVNDPKDAIMGAANYLHASGGSTSIRRALYAYNPSASYVDAVMRYATLMKQGPAAFVELYSWQVFALTTSGVVRLTGPGRRINR
jgi:soluble lytic murein transglycosylase-like protein